MSIYDANYYKQAAEAMPPNKRKRKYLMWIFSLISPMNWLRHVYFEVFKKGVAYPEYAAGTYAKGDRVKYTKAIFESLIDSNTSDPTVTASWLKISDNFIGVDERIRFNAQKIIFEYALNKWFNTDAHPCVWSNIPGASSIYITNNSIVTGNFVVSSDDAGSSAVGTDDSTESVGGDGADVIQLSYTINVPTAVFNALGADDSIREATVRNFADLYNPVGLFYKVLTY